MKTIILKISLSLALGMSGVIISFCAVAGFYWPSLPAYAAGTRYVTPAGLDAGNTCADSASPCATIQHAVDVAEAGDVIKVASGTYTDVNNYGGFAQVVYISKTVTLRGGYTPAFTDPPDPEINLTTIDAQGLGRVLYITGDITSTIEGFQIAHGDATNINSENYDLVGEGGGLLIISATVTLRQNSITSNFAPNAGGGLFLIFANTSLINNEIISNTSFYGGGFHTYFGETSLKGNTIKNNRADAGGGGVLGGGSGATVEQNLFIDNQAGSVAGGLGIVGDKVHVTNNIIAGNQSNGSGAGLYIVGHSQLRHNTIVENYGGDGTGIDIGSSDTTVSNVVMINNIVANHTVALTVATGNTATLENTLWSGNATDQAGAGLIITHNDISGDPAFVDPLTGDYHLGPTSIAINRGVEAGVAVDIDNDLRDAWPDLGADENLNGTVNRPLPVTGGAVTLAPGVSLSVTSGVFNDTILLTYTPQSPPSPANFKNVGLAYQLSAIFQSNGQPAQPQPGQHYTIALTYQQSNVPPDIGESDLALYFWNGSRWLKESTSAVNPATNTITATPSHFSRWAVLAPVVESPQQLFLPLVIKK